MAANTDTFDESFHSDGQHTWENMPNDMQSQGDQSHRYQLPPAEDLDIRQQEIHAANNPLLEAAKPLLLALAQIARQDLKSTTEVLTLKALLEQEIIAFTTLCSRENIRREHAVAASFCLTTALDEAINSTTWGGGHADRAGVWSEHMLAARFHQDIQGGKKFFLLLGRLTQLPKEHMHLLEVMYQILSLGFEGQFAGDPQGARSLETIRYRLLSLVSSGKEAPSRELSTHWLGVQGGRLAMLKTIPVWVTAALTALCVLGVFSFYKYSLVTRAQKLEEKILEIGRLTPATIPVADTGNKLHLATLLKPEINRGILKVDESANMSWVTLKGDAMFASGDVVVNEQQQSLLARIAQSIAQVNGRVQVIGHTDHSPIQTALIPNNKVLSEKRAENVASILIKHGVDASRITVIGKGDTDPTVVSNNPKDMAMNRRVQIVVSY